MPVSSATLASGCTVASWCRDAVQASTGRAAIAASSVSVMVPPDGVVHRAPAGVEGLRRPRAHHIDALTDDAGLAFILGLNALPKATHLGTYSYRVHR